ncbi:MAG: sulfatase-like hydrolase/transferase [Thaumarchaeota archaeon]|nr:sulfatase-like hydrolase/transferase [Nitrososphaerota archaeon]
MLNKIKNFPVLLIPVVLCVFVVFGFSSVSADTPTTLSLQPVNNVPWSQSVTITGSLINNTGSGLAGKQVTFTGTGSTSFLSVVTNSTGGFSVTGTAPSTVANGWTVQAHFAGDSFCTSSESNAILYNTIKHKTNLGFSITPAKTSPSSHFKIVGTIIDSITKAGISSQKISFSATSPIIVNKTTTNSSGKFAITDLMAPNIFGNYTIQASFSGNSSYEKSFSSKKTLTVSESKPNFIVIMTDDQRWNDFVSMPSVKSRIADQGINFTNFFISYPLCCPSRATFLTGLYAHNHGVLSNSPPFGAKSFNDTSTLAVWLKQKGYTTSLIGKYMNGYDEIAPKVPPGWNDWHVFYFGGYYNYSLSENGVKHYFGNKADDYGTDVIKDRAMKFIKTANRPFFLEFTPYAPHNGNPYPVVAPRHIGTCDNLTSTKEPSYNETDVSDKPAFVKKQKPLRQSDADVLDSDYKTRICSLKAVDEAVAGILDTLGPEINNTMIIYMTDNGYMLGEHRLAGKIVLYDESIRSPLLVRYPPFISDHQVNDKLISNIDLAPTIASLAGITPPTKVDGMSFVPMIKNENSTWRDGVLLENLDPNGTIPTMYGVRTIDFKYLELDTGEKELYDLRIDPYELDNKINDTTYTDIINDLTMKLAALKQE